MNTNIGFNDDYACVYAYHKKSWEPDNGKIQFYFGYEEINEKEEWCFTARKGDKELVRYSKSELMESNPDLQENHMPERFLVQGMFLFTNRN